MSAKTWTFAKDDSIQCQQLTAEYVEQVVDMMASVFLRHETICKAIGLSEDHEAVAEVKELARVVAKDGISVVAVDKTKNKVIGAAINRLQVKDESPSESPFSHLVESFKQPRSLLVLNLIDEFENMCNLFDLCQADCIFEIMFLMTSPEYRGRGLGKRLCEASIEMAQNLKDGINVKVAVDEQKLNLEPIPKACSAIFTTFITQRIGKELGFQIAAERSYDELEYEGRSYSSVIGKETRGATMEYKMLI